MSASVEGLVGFIEGEESEGGPVKCFDVGRVEAEGGGAVEGCGAIVFWQGQKMTVGVFEWGWKQY